MMSATMQKPPSAINPDRIIAGSAVVALGLLLLLQQVGYPVAGQILEGWWPVVIAALGGAHFAASRGRSLGSLIVLLLGVVLLARTLDFLPGSILGLIWPVLLVGIGISILFHRAGAQASVEHHATSDENNLDLSASFSGVTHVSHAPRFHHARLNATLGGIVLDLRNATLDPEGAAIDVSATCGGADIRVPVGWQVEMSGSPLFGGYESEALQGDVVPPNAPRLRVNVTAICGGVSVKH
jgi:predicted membrane protein